MTRETLERADGSKVEVYHLADHESILDNTTTSGRRIIGPASVTRHWHADGSCLTTTHDYEPSRSVESYFPFARQKA